MKHHQADRGPIMVIGGTVVDITATARKDMSVSMLHSSFPGTTRISLGGVGRNVAEAVSKLNAEGCVFVSAVGGAGAKSEIGDGEQGDTVADDLFGPWLIGEIDRKGLHNLEIHQVPGARTATYTALHDATGNLLSAVADMDVFELLPPTKVKEAIMKHRPKTVCFDGNISSECMRTIMETCRDHNIQSNVVALLPFYNSRVMTFSPMFSTLQSNNSFHYYQIPAFFEPTSVVKCVRPLEESALDALLDGALNFASPNEYELQKMAISARRLISDHKHHVRLRELKDRPVHGGLQDPEDVAVAITSGDNSAYKSLLLEAFSVSQFIPTLFIKLGAKGVLVFQRTTGAKLRMAAIVEGSVEEEEEDKRKMPADIEDWTQSGEIKWKLFPAHDVDSIKSVTGAGDSFVASVVTSLHNLDKVGSTEDPPSPSESPKATTGLGQDRLWKHMDQIVKDGQTAATLTMQTHKTVSPALATSTQALRLRQLTVE
ncbi:hypothetical protein BGZ58_000277 [Dissophora ornata]|nr:hypothetical protein BGZ58_000277 [Dissophora ornata]